MLIAFVLRCPFIAGRLPAAVLALAVSIAAVGHAAEPEMDNLRMNQIPIRSARTTAITSRDKPIASGRATEWNYTHPPLDVQLDRGVRSFELDLHYKNGEFEVFHVPILDEGTTCRKLADALAPCAAGPRPIPATCRSPSSSS